MRYATISSRALGNSWDVEKSPTVGGDYSLDSIVMILKKYIIQLKNTMEGDINDLDDIMLYTLAKHLVLLYHPPPPMEPTKFSNRRFKNSIGRL